MQRWSCENKHQNHERTARCQVENMHLSFLSLSNSVFAFTWIILPVDALYFIHNHFFSLWLITFYFKILCQVLIMLSYSLLVQVTCEVTNYLVLASSVRVSWPPRLLQLMEWAPVTKGWENLLGNYLQLPKETKYLWMCQAFFDP